jgi:histidinol-phosphatase (PHP family)
MYKNLCYHTHNFFCDGKNSIEEMIQYAVYQGVTHIGISSHAPLKISNSWSISKENLEDYANTIDNLKLKYKDKINVFKSLEIDFIPNLTFSFDYFKELLSLDYTIGSIHLVRNPENNQLWFIDGDQKQCHKNFNTIFNSNIKHAVASYYNQMREMVKTQQPDIIGHLDKVVMNTANHFFNENDQWYIDEVVETLEVIKKNNSIIEINTRGLYKNKWETSFPSPAILKIANNLKIPIIISSDAHHTSELLGSYENAAIIAESCGYTKQLMFEQGIWKETNIN